MLRVFSPYVANLMKLNPLRYVVAEEIDFANVRAYKDIHLFISATDVEPAICAYSAKVRPNLIR